jgi:hypothetical protein
MREACTSMKDASSGPTYRLVVRGELDGRYACLFEGMTMEQVAGTTVLTGCVVDQARLHGFIERIQELGLELLEIQQVKERTAPSTDPSAGD